MEKELFYEHLEMTTQTDPTHWNIDMGDFEAKLGQKQEPDKVYITLVDLVRPKKKIILS